MTILRRFHRLRPHLRAQRKRLLFGILCLPAHAVATLALPALMGSVINSLVAGTPLRPLGMSFAPGEGIGATCLLFVALALLESWLRYASRKLIIDGSRYVEQGLKSELTARMLTLPMPWFDRARTGDLVSRFTQDVELLRFTIGPVILHGGSALMIVPGGLALMLATSMPVTLACGVGFAVMVWGLRRLVPRLHAESVKVQDAIGALSQRVQEDFAGARTVQGFALGDREAAAVAHLNRRYVVHNQHLARLRGMVNVLLHTVGNLVVLSVLVVGGLQVVEGHLAPGSLFEFLLYLGLMMWPLQALGWSASTLPRAVAAADRIEELFAVEPEARTGHVPDGPGHLEVRALTFEFDRPEGESQSSPVLRDVSFSLPPGSTLGIVGTVGSGKSTLLALLMRFYDPPRGTVFFDGVDVLDIDPHALRRHFAFAPQDPFLFSDTLAHNVGLGKGGLRKGDQRPGNSSSEEHLALAVSRAALDADLATFPDGIFTMVGERGVALSGGQRQRVSLARALAADRPGLLLDDTLSAVDVATEARILDGLRADREGRGQRRTVVIASHRLTAVMEADEILVLHNGRVIEHGDHTSLLAHGGTYAEAWSLQRQGRTLEGDGPAGDPKGSDREGDR